MTFETDSERFEDKDALEKIRRLLAGAELLVFLGFAFHRQNMLLLGPDRATRTKRVIATAYGMSSSDCRDVIAQINEAFKPAGTKGGRVDLENELKCAGLFQEFWRSLTALR